MSRLPDFVYSATTADLSGDETLYLYLVDASGVVKVSAKSTASDFKDHILDAISGYVDGSDEASLSGLDKLAVIEDVSGTPTLRHVTLFDLQEYFKIPDITATTLANGANTLANPVGSFTDGYRKVWRLKQPSSGAAGTVTLGNKFRIPSSASSPLPFSTTNSKIDYLAAVYNLTDDKWDIVSFVPGY